jgi:pyruvate kinase
MSEAGGAAVARERKQEQDAPRATSAPSLTKIVATLGPATDEPGVLRRLLENGASIFRLNFSHGTFEEHAARVKMVRAASREADVPAAILGDLPGPKIRIGRVPGEGIRLEPGQDFVIRRGVAEASDGEIPLFPCTYEPIVQEVDPGHRVLINDGSIRGLATGRSGDELRCVVTTGGLVTTGKGVNLPDSDISAPAITEKDWVCAEFAVEHDLDYLALSFVRRADEVRRLREALDRMCAGSPREESDAARRGDPALPIISKIEKPQAVERIDEILEATDGVMVARGDLGVEMDIASVPITQKMIIRKAQDYGKPTIVATQMLESMIDRASPTRAEASDVANAIFDMADAVMLSGETAVGKFGPLAVEMMHRIALATEARLREEPAKPSPPTRVTPIDARTAAITRGAFSVVLEWHAKFVAVWSQSGRSARWLSFAGLHTPVLAFSSDERAVRRMALLYGVTPVLWRDLPSHRSDFHAIVDGYIMERGLAEVGDPIVLLSGKPFGKPGTVNTVEARRVGDSRRA